MTNANSHVALAILIAVLLGLSACGGGGGGGGSAQGGGNWDQVVWDQDNWA